MYSFRAESANEVWLQALKGIHQTHIIKDSRVFNKAEVGETIEFPEPVAMIVENPQDRLVTARAVNPAFAIAEVIWILAGSNQLDFIKFWNPVMKNFSDDGERLHGAYGHRLGTYDYGRWSLTSPDIHVGAEGSNQLEQAYVTLAEVPHSRQVILQIWDKNRDLPCTKGKPNAKDIPCNIVADLKVRNGKLYWTQFMRSNDLIWGTPYNFMQWMTLQEIMAGWLGLELGTYTHIATSLHVYERHYYEMSNIVADDAAERLPKHWAPVDHIHGIQNYDTWKRIFSIVLKTATDFTHMESPGQLMAAYRQAGWDLDKIDEASDEARSAYFHWIALLAAEATRRYKFATLDEIINDRSWLSAIDNYYWFPWLKWAGTLTK